MVVSVTIGFDRPRQVLRSIHFYENSPSHKVPVSPIEGPRSIPGQERNLTHPKPVGSGRLNWEIT